MNDIIEIDGIKLDHENRQFFQAAEHVKNSSQNIIYLTGKAGTGKTTFSCSCSYRSSCCKCLWADYPFILQT